MASNRIVKRPLAWIYLLPCSALGLLAMDWGIGRHAKDFGFGPPSIHDWPDSVTEGVPLSMRPAAQARMIDMGKAANVRVSRVDPQIAASQSWEPSIVVVDHDPATANDDEISVTWMLGLATSTLTDTRIGLATSRDGGSNWIRGELSPPSNATNIQFDPMTAHDPVSGRTYLGALSRNFSTPSQSSLWMADKTAGALAFAPARMVRPATPTDKGWMAAGPLPGGQGGSALYIAYDGPGSIGQLQRSTDGGLSFSAPLDLPGTIAYHPRVDRQGVLSITYYDNGIGRFLRSRDGGLTFDPAIAVTPFAGSPQAFQSAVAGDFRVPYFLMHAIDSRNGRIYVVYNDITAFTAGDADIDLLMRDSIDGGNTWSAPRNLSTDPEQPADQYLPWLEVDESGTLHLAWYDTRRSTGDDSAASAMIDVYYGTSSDGGQTWLTQRLTDTPLDSARTNWNPAGFSSQFVGDYIGLAVTERATYVAFPGHANDGVAMQVARIDRAGIDAGIDASHTGSWVNFNENGHGMLVEVLDGNRILAWWYTFQPGGGQAWFGGIGTYSGSVATIPVVRAEGARFLPQFNPADVSLTQLGTMTLTFESCSRAQVDYALGQGFGTGRWTMERLTVPKGLTCAP